MTDPQTAKQLFLEMIELPESRRADFLDRECSAYPLVRERVQKLLRDHDLAAGFMEPPALIASPSLAALDIAPGAVIDNYKLLQQIGEGGFEEFTVNP